MDEYLGCFYLFVIVYSEAMNICVQVFECMFLVLLSICIGVELMDPTVITFLTFEGTIKLFSTVVVPFYILINSVGRVPVSSEFP